MIVVPLDKLAVRVRSEFSALSILAAITAGLYFTLPLNGDIWWMDASRNALNGAFVLDFLRAMPVRHPLEFAMDYYRQWPALTIGFYPPLYYFVLAVSYSIFGVSESSAVVPELVFMFLIGCGAYYLSRRWLNSFSALAVAILLMGAPELCFWGRQIMLDIPAYAFLIWAMEFLLRYIKGTSNNALYVSVILIVLSIYTKYNAAFIFLPITVTLIYAKGWRFLYDRHALRAAALGAALLLPLFVIFFELSSYNLEQATAIPGATVVLWSFGNISYYAQTMASVISWPTVCLAFLYCALSPFVDRLRLSRIDSTLLTLWVGIGYAFYTLIAVKDPRHILAITYPIVLAAILLVDRLPHQRSFLSNILPLTISCGVLALSLVREPAPYVTGMRQAAEDVGRLAPSDTNVAFWGRFDGTFIYAMRAYSNRLDLGVIRLDKLLLTGVQIALERGFSEKALTSDEIADELETLHVQYVVVQTIYGDELGVIHELSDALQSNRFQEIERIPMTSNYKFSYINELVIYRATADVPHGRVVPPIELKIIRKVL